MSRYKTKDYSNRREYLDWLAERYGVDRADVVLLASILGTDQDFDGLPSTLADLPAAKHTQGAVFPTDRPKRAKPSPASAGLWRATSKGVSTTSTTTSWSTF